VVTLTGDVRDVRARVRASEVAHAVPGVRAVKNELKEKTS
jgi:osmotically-inducible protein OsmY